MVATDVANWYISAAICHIQYEIKHAGNVEGKPFFSGLQDEPTVTRTDELSC